ncbi:unnamed protein product, partial [Ectocarpus sp. 12 AP-2014]
MLRRATPATAVETAIVALVSAVCGVALTPPFVELIFVAAGPGGLVTAVGAKPFNLSAVRSQHVFFTEVAVFASSDVWHTSGGRTTCYIIVIMIVLFCRIHPDVSTDNFDTSQVDIILRRRYIIRGGRTAARPWTNADTSNEYPVKILLPSATVFVLGPRSLTPKGSRLWATFYSTSPMCLDVTSTNHVHIAVRARPTASRRHV